MDNDTKKTFKYLFDHLTEDDRKLIELHHSSHIGEGSFEKCNGILDVLKLLHQRGVLNNRQQTLILLNSIGRKDLVKGLDKEISDSTHKFKVVKTCGGKVVLKSPVTIQNITEIIITQTEDPWDSKKIDPASYILTGTNHDVLELTLPNRKKCYTLNVLANGPEGKQINVVCDNLAIYYEAECGFITYDDNDFLLIAHNNGTPENVHFFQPPKDVKTDDSPCQRVLKGATKAAKTIGEFKEMARDLFKDNDYVFRFPPSNESTNDSINTFVDSLEKLPLFKETRFFIGYDIIEHLKLFQLFEERSCSVNFENLLFFLNPKDGVFGVLKYVDSREESILQTALDECNTVLNSCLALYGELFKRTYMLLYGGVVAPNISRVDLKESSYRCLNEDYSDLGNRRNVVFITKDDLESPTKLKSWWNRVKKIFRQERKDRGVGSKMDIIKEFNDISSQIVAVMSLHHQSLPRMTKDVKDRVTNLLLNKDQLKILQTRQSRFKVIEGPFGSGKSLVLKALAKKLHRETNNGQIFYICWDPYSLIEAEVHNNFETLKNNEHIDGANLICLNFKELSEVIDDFEIEELLQSFGTIREPLNKFLAYCRTDDGPVHLLIDEFPGVNVDSEVCEEIKHHLTEIDNRSTLVIALQSTDKSYEIRSQATDFPVPKENLTKAGLKTFKLTKSMRMCHNLYQLIQIAQKEVVDSNLPIAAEDNISTSRRRRNFSGSLSTNTREDLLTSSQTEENSEHSSGFGSYETNTPLQSPPSSDQDKTPMKANVGKIHEPEVVLKTLFDSLKRQPSKSLRTKYKYPRGASGHDINSHCKPQILYLPEEFDYNLESICLLGAVFDRICLDENHHCTIICNDKQELSMVKKALRTLGRDYVDYADYLKGLLPDRKRKLDVMQKLSEDSFILVTDYRSFRGCETDHCVTFVRPEECYTDHVLIEILTRAITKIDLIVYPQTAAQPDANTVNDSLSKVLNAWKGYPDLVSTRICGAFSLDRQTNQMDFKIDEEEHKVPLEEVVWDETMLEPTLDDNSGIRHLKQAVDKVICGAEQTNRKGDQLVECVSDVSMQTPNQPNKIYRKRRSEEAAEASAEKKAKMQTNEKMEDLKSKRIDLDEKKSYAFERTINIGAWSGFAKTFLPPDIERFSDEKSLDFVNFIATFEQALKIIKCGLNVSYDGVSVINCSEMNRDEFRDLRLLPLYPSSGIPLAFSSDGNVSYASQLDAGFNISLLNAYYVDFVEFRNQMNVHVLLTTKRYENLAPVDLEDAKGAIFKKDNKYYYNTQWNAKFITVKLLTDAQIPYSTASFVRPTRVPKEIIDCKETPKFQPVFLDHTLGCLFFTYLEYESQSSNGKIRFLPIDESLKSQFLDEINKISIDDKDDTSDTSEQSDQLINQLQMPRTFRTGVSIDNEDIHVLKCLDNAFATNFSVPQPHLCIRRILEILTGYVKSSNTFKNSLPVSKTVLVFANQFNVRLGMAIRKQIRDFVFRIHGK